MSFEACKWKQCGGWMKEVGVKEGEVFKIIRLCSKCGRSNDLSYELKVEREQAREHKNLQAYAHNYAWQQRLKARNLKLGGS